MAYNIHYILQFYDLLNVLWTVTLSQENYAGGVIPLRGAAEPLNIRYEGDQSDPFDPVRKSKATLSVLIDKSTMSLFDDTDDITDRTISVQISNSANNYLWDGWLIPDQRQARILEQGYYMQLVAIDPLSLADGLNFVDFNGGILQGKNSFYVLLDYALRKATNINQGIRIRLNSELIYEGMSMPGYPQFDNLLFGVTGYAENFAGSNDRPNKSLDVVRKICTAFGLYIFRENLNFVIRSPHALTAQQITTYTSTERIDNDQIFYSIHSKAQNDEPGFLLDQSDNITSDRPAKELSVKFTYDNVISLIVNPDFYIYDSATNTFAGWENHLSALAHPATVTRAGSGRPLDPYAMRIIGYDFDVDTVTPVQGMAGHSYRNVSTGDFLTVKIKFKWYDYKKANPGVSFPVIPAVKYRLRVTDGTKTYYYLHVASALPDGSGDTAAAHADIWEEYALDFSSILINSTDNIQEISFTTQKPLPVSGQLIIEIYPLFVRPTTNPEWNAVNKYIDIISVGIGTNIDSQGNTVTGETNYITQSREYSLIEGTVDVDLGDTPTIEVSGALFKNGLEQHPINALTTTWVNRLSPLSNTGILKNLLRIWMYFRRQPKRIIECDVFANDLHFEHILLFNELATTAMEGRFMQLNSEYNVRHCKHHIIAIRLQGSFKDSGADKDLYETYTETSNNS